MICIYATLYTELYYIQGGTHFSLDKSVLSAIDSMYEKTFAGFSNFLILAPVIMKKT